MSDKLKLFLNKVSSDAAWKAELETIKDKAEIVAKVIEKANELGIELTAADFEQPEGELSADELAVVTGGSCGCIGAGGGGGTDADGDTYGCACGTYGQGGDGSEDHFNCLCVAGGYGKKDGIF